MDEPVLALFRKNIPWTEEIVEKDPAAEGKYKMDLWECNRRLWQKWGQGISKFRVFAPNVTKNVFIPIEAWAKKEA